MNVEECGQLRRIDSECFEYCVALRQLRIPATLESVKAWAFYGSGIEVLDFAGCANLQMVGADGAHWLTEVRLPPAFRGGLNLCYAWRVEALSCGVCATWHDPRLGRFRSTAVRRRVDAPTGHSISKAWITAELPAISGRQGLPVMPL